MPYTPNNWVDGPSGNTPITAAQLSHLETQYTQAAAYTDDTISNEVSRADAAYAGQAAMGIVLPVGSSYAQIQAACTSAATFGTRVWASGALTTSSTLTVTSPCDLSGLSITYTGSGVAVQVGSSTVTRRKTFRLPDVTYGSKPTTGWVAGTVGVQLTNLSDCEIYLGNIQSFESGLICYGLSNEYAYSQHHVRGLNNNKVNLTLAADSTGYVNGNQFYGGRYSHNSSEGTQVAGVFHVYLTDIVTSRPNGNNWYGASLESPNVVQWALNIESGQYNMFIGCRWEDTSGTPRVRYGPKALQNQIQGGYSADSIAFTNVSGSSRNVIATADRWVQGAAGTPVMRLENTGSSGSLSFAVYNAGTIAGTTAYNPTADWVVGIQATGIRVKNKADTFDRVFIDQSGPAGGRLQLGSGTVAADVNLYRGAADLLKTDDKMVAAGGIGVGNSAAATTLGSVVKKMEVFDASGASLGFVPIYDNIT